MDYLIDGVQLTTIADAIRGKTGKIDTMTVDEMPDEISGISSSGGATILNGTSLPSNQQGNDGDIYVQQLDIPDLPEEYTSLSYIQTGSTAGAYINTGLTSSADISCEISAQLTGIPNDNTWFYGAFSESKGSPILGLQNNRFEGYIVSGGVIQAADTNIHTFVVDANGISVDGEVKQIGTWGSISVGAPLCLFARGGDGRAINNIRIFYCKQWDSGILVRHFIPAIRNSDDTIGMYDIINDEFYPNQGINSFIGGYRNNMIIDIFLKVNSSWQPLIGSSIDDINTHGSSGLELIQRAEWNALTTEEKQSYGLLAIQDVNIGFERGILVNGSDYVEKSWDFTIVETGSTSGTATYEFEESGTYQLFMIAINSEASTFSLDNTASLNGNAITGEDLKYNEWDGSTSDKRNYRITKFEFNANANDTLSFETSNVSGYTTTIYAVIKSDIISAVKTLSSADNITSGTYNEQAIVMYGTSNSNVDGTISIEAYSPNTLITTPSPGQSYKSSYIFWFGI